MTRTTIGFDEDLLRRLKRRAAAENRSLQALVNDLVRQGLAANRKGVYSLDLRGFDAELRPGVDLTDRDQLFDAPASR